MRGYSTGKNFVHSPFVCQALQNLKPSTQLANLKFHKYIASLSQTRHQFIRLHIIQTSLLRGKFKLISLNQFSRYKKLWRKTSPRSPYSDLFSCQHLFICPNFHEMNNQKVGKCRNRWGWTLISCSSKKLTELMLAPLTLSRMRGATSQTKF